MSIEALLSRLTKVRKKPKGGYWACCPVHDEKTPSLSIDERDGKILLTCWGCHAGGAEICEALGLDISELFDTPLTDSAPNPKRAHAWDVLAALRTEMMVAVMITKRAADGTLTDEDRQRLLTCAQRLETGADYAKTEQTTAAQRAALYGRR